MKFFTFYEMRGGCKYQLSEIKINLDWLHNVGVPHQLYCLYFDGFIFLYFVT